MAGAGDIMIWGMPIAMLRLIMLLSISQTDCGIVLAAASKARAERRRHAPGSDGSGRPPCMPTRGAVAPEALISSIIEGRNLLDLQFFRMIQRLWNLRLAYRVPNV